MIKTENVLRAIEEIGNTEDKLIEVLIKVQERSSENYITESQLEEISQELEIPLSKVYGVASFYSLLSTHRRGENVIQICNSGPCYVRGSRNIVKMFESALGIKMGEVTDDGKFSLEFTSCIGSCDVAPSAKINEEVCGNLDEKKIDEIINSIRKGVK